MARLVAKHRAHSSEFHHGIRRVRYLAGGDLALHAGTVMVFTRAFILLSTSAVDVEGGHTFGPSLETKNSFRRVVPTREMCGVLCVRQSVVMFSVRLRRAGGVRFHADELTGSCIGEG